MIPKIFKNDLSPEAYSLLSLDSIGIDTETLGLNILRDRLCLVQIANRKGDVFMVQFDGKDYSAPLLKKLLEGDKTKIFHFGRFDIGTLRYYLDLPKITNVFCTKICSRLVRTFTDSHGLKALCRDILGVELDKESQTSDWSVDILSDKQIKYAANDVIYLHRLKDYFEAKLNVLSRINEANACFEFLHTVVSFDIDGFDATSIINH